MPQCSELRGKVFDPVHQAPGSSICKFLAGSPETFQGRGVRGSPLVRFLLLALALAATAAGLSHVTSSRGLRAPAERPPESASQPRTAVPFRLALSAAASSVEIDTGHAIRLPANALPISGTLELDPQNPRVALIVRWTSPPTAGERRFAKLTLEAPGQDTFTHVFDAEGDIDDFLELPFPAEK